MNYELRLLVAIESDFGPDRIESQIRGLFEFGTITDALSEGLKLRARPGLRDVEIVASEESR